MRARIGTAFLLALLALPFAPSANADHHHEHSHVSVGIGLGFGGWPYYYPPPAYYYPPPVYYVPPAVYYTPPPPVYIAPMPTPATATPSECRVFSGDATNDQTGKPYYGRACLWPDGRWHIVS